MQEVIQDRKACRNVFELLDFIFVDYDVYMKSRLVSLACGRSTYRNTFGLNRLQVCKGKVAITSLGPSTFCVKQELEGEVTDVIVEMTSGACSLCVLTKFCEHVCTVACSFPESMVCVFLIVVLNTSCTQGLDLGLNSADAQSCLMEVASGECYDAEVQGKRKAGTQSERVAAEGVKANLAVIALKKAGERVVDGKFGKRMKLGRNAISRRITATKKATFGHQPRAQAYGRKRWRTHTEALIAAERHAINDDE